MGKRQWNCIYGDSYIRQLFAENTDGTTTQFDALFSASHGLEDLCQSESQLVLNELLDLRFASHEILCEAPKLLHKLQMLDADPEAVRDCILEVIAFETACDRKQFRAFLLPQWICLLTSPSIKGWLELTEEKISEAAMRGSAIRQKAIERLHRMKTTQGNDRNTSLLELIFYTFFPEGTTEPIHWSAFGQS